MKKSAVENFIELVGISKELFGEIWHKCHKLSYATKHFYSAYSIYLENLERDGILRSWQAKKIYDFTCDLVLSFH